MKYIKSGLFDRSCRAFSTFETAVFLILACAAIVASAMMANQWYRTYSARMVVDELSEFVAMAFNHLAEFRRADMGRDVLSFVYAKEHISEQRLDDLGVNFHQIDFYYDSGGAGLLVMMIGFDKEICRRLLSHPIPRMNYFIMQADMDSQPLIGSLNDLNDRPVVDQAKKICDRFDPESDDSPGVFMLSEE